MKLDNRNEISFFKVLRSESAKYIQVPTPFAKKYLEKGNKIQNVVLKTKSQVEWNVEFVKINDGYYFTEGWFKFKKDNHLQTFDFLVFFLRSRAPNLTTFEVFFYATNGCQKSLLSSRSANFPQAETEIGCDDLSKTVRQKLLERAITKSCIHQVPLTKRFVKAIGIEGLCDLKLENDEGKIWEADLKIWGQLKIPFIVKGWADFMKDKKLKIGNRCVFSHAKGNILHVHVIKRKKALAKRLHTPSTSRNACSSDGKKLWIEELEASDNDSSKKVESSLILRKVVKKSYTRQMQLSKRFVKEAGMDGYLYLQLENDDGKTWEVELKKRGPRQMPHIGEGWSKFVKDNKPLTKVFENTTGVSRYDTLLLKNKEGKKWKVDIRRYNQKQQLLCITKGWAKLMKDNKVEIGDKCEFKHLKGKVLKGKVVRVHVFKKKRNK